VTGGRSSRTGLLTRPARGTRAETPAAAGG